jgi:hypothetical protein
MNGIIPGKSLLAFYKSFSIYPATYLDPEPYESTPGYLVISLYDPPECLVYRKESREEENREGTLNYLRKDMVLSVLSLIYYTLRATMRRYLVKKNIVCS